MPRCEADIGRLSLPCTNLVSSRELPAIIILPEVHQVALVGLVRYDGRRESEPTLRDDEGGLTRTVKVDQFLLCVRT